MYDHDIILLRSMTLAQRSARMLQKAGIFASVTKAPQQANPGGCAYGVKVGNRNMDAALRLLREANIPTGAVFALHADGSVSEVAR